MSGCNRRARDDPRVTPSRSEFDRFDGSRAVIYRERVYGHVPRDYADR